MCDFSLFPPLGPHALITAVCLAHPNDTPLEATPKQQRSEASPLCPKQCSQTMLSTNAPNHAPKHAPKHASSPAPKHAPNPAPNHASNPAPKGAKVARRPCSHGGTSWRKPWTAAPGPKTRRARFVWGHCLGVASNGVSFGCTGYTAVIKA